MTGLSIDSYAWAGGREAMLRIGPQDGPVVVVAPALFEEANRTRALVVATLRALASRGVASALPDLPGQGDSTLPTVETRLPDWRSAFAAAAEAAGERRYVFAVRAGALIDGEASVLGRLHLAPEPGRVFVRDLLRIRRATALAAGEPLPADDPSAPGPPLSLAGNLISRELLQALMAAETTQADRVLMLFPSKGSADRRLAPDRPQNRDGDLPRFRTPWSAAEPFVDHELAAMLAADIADWIGSCDS